MSNESNGFFMKALIALAVIAMLPAILPLLLLLARFLFVWVIPACIVIAVFQYLAGKTDPDSGKRFTNGHPKAISRTIVVCPHCDAANDVDAKYCSQCGALLG
jgi:hypothetical protein